MACANPDALGQSVHRGRLTIECAIPHDQSGGSIDNCTTAFPRRAKRRSFWPASQTRSKARRLCRCCRGEESDVLWASRTHGADRAAIYAGGPHAGEEQPVIGWISPDPCSLALIVIRHPVAFLLCLPGDGVRIRRASRSSGGYHYVAKENIASKGWRWATAKIGPSTMLSGQP